jgi:hypothetical protein
LYLIYRQSRTGTQGYSHQNKSLLTSATSQGEGLRLRKQKHYNAKVSRASRARILTGLIAGVLIILSGLAHSLLGGQGIGAQLDAAKVPPDLAVGVRIGWQFGGVAMLAFGAMIIALFNQRSRGQTVSMLPAGIIAAAYLAFGCYALVSSGFNPFFAVFIIPGALLAFAARG